jgi:hypothetical protein
MPRLALIIPMPTSPIERLAARVREYLHLPDPGPLYVLCGAVAANMIEGAPVWLMLVGPPSCGKSELLNSLLEVPHMVGGADIAGEAAFLSGTSRKEKAQDATGGLLREIGDHGGLILNDFTSILSKPPEKINSIMAILRECYGGRWTRHIGGEGGRRLTWVGKLAMLAGCTSRIDQCHQINSELGERWIYYRFEHRDVFADTMLALSNGRNGWREDFQATMRDFFQNLDLCFGEVKPRREFTHSERLRLHELALLASRCRSAVTRDSYSKEIVAAREDELAIRLSTVLAQLLVGMDAVGVPKKTAWHLLGKVAMDSMPRLRKLTVDAAALSKPTVEELQVVLGCSLSVVKRVVEDLHMHGVVDRIDGRVCLTEWMQKQHNRFCQASSAWTPS